MRGGASVFILGEFMKFTIREVKASREGTLPAHYDLFGEGKAVATIWTSLEDAEYIAKALERREAIESLFLYLDRPGLIGG